MPVRVHACIRFALVLALLCASLPEAHCAKPTAEAVAFFEKKIRPVLVEHCYKCHSAQGGEAKGGLRLDHRDAMRAGGESGPAVVPGDVDASGLIAALRYESFEMPPDGKLPDEVIADFAHWVKLGAPDPRVPQQSQRREAQRATSNWWSLQSVRPPPVPAVKDAGWPRSDIDCFVLARLEGRQLHPLGDASPAALLRRVYLDLIGLPPSPDELDTFLASPTPQAFADVVDRLLASPQFGERWGRHWLDIVRYAESNGRDRDVLYPHAWRYRNYVIAALNDDVPYDRFVAEQLAGDLMPADAQQERDRLRIATGFLALGPKTLMSKAKFRMDLVDDQIDATSRAFLGLTVSCARCHDHKFDPIPTRDYYALAGIFRSTETLYGGGLKRKKKQGTIDPDLQPLGSAADVAAAKQQAERLAQLDKQLGAAKKKLAALEKQAGKKNGAKAAERDKAAAQVARLERELKQLRSGSSPQLQYCMAVRDADKPADCPIHIRGEERQLGEKVPRGVLSALSVPPAKIPGDASGRLQLAEWIADPKNPLTARVAVNRIWHHLFGQGIVRTVDNFGYNGEPPSHPGLLDHLAAKFVEFDGSVKRLIRYIVLSRVYQLESRYDEGCYAVDPENRLLWRAARRRLEVEAIRHAMLAASGRLDLQPPERSQVARIGPGEVGRGINMKPFYEPFPHRSVYLPILRTHLPEVLQVFDVAEPSIVVGRRSVTTVPAQSLYFLNSPFVIAQAEAAARRALQHSDHRSERIEFAYKLCLARFPTQSESAAAAQYLEGFAAQAEEQSGQETGVPAAWTSFCQALFASAEFRYVP